MLHDWQNVYPTRIAAAKKIGRVVHFEEAVSLGTGIEPFLFPVALRPTNMVYIPLDLCDATKGDLILYPAGYTSIRAAGDGFKECFTSLEGASLIP